MRHLLGVVGTSLLVASLGVGLSDDAAAQSRDRQFRKMELTDGRQFIAEVLDTEAAGLRIELPQGQALVSFEILYDITPSTQAAYDTQPNRTLVVVAPEAERADLLRMAATIPALDVVLMGEAKGDVTAEQAEKAKAECTEESVKQTFCVAKAVAGDPWRMVLGLHAKDDSSQQMVGKIAGNSTRTIEVIKAGDRQAKWDALHAVLGLEPSVDAPPEDPTQNQAAKPQKVGAMLNDVQVGRLSLVPIPGFPSFKQKDASSGLAAWGIVIPATAAIGLGAAQGNKNGKTSQVLGLTAAGFYASTVFANNLMGTRSMKKNQGKAVGVILPRIDGGVDVGLTGSF